MAGVYDKNECIWNKKTYNNMMGYLRDLKLHDDKYGEMTDRIYLLSETNVAKLDELRKELDEKLALSQQSAQSSVPEHSSMGNVSNPSDTKETRELLKRTENLQRQMRELIQLLKSMNEMQIEANACAGANTDTYTSVRSEADSGGSNTLSYEEFKEMQKNWQQFEQRMESKFENQNRLAQTVLESQVSSMHTDVENAKAVIEELYEDIESVKTVARDLHDDFQNVKTAAENMQDGYAEVKTAAEDLHIDFQNVKTATDRSLQGISAQLEDYEQEVRAELAQLRQFLSENSGTRDVDISESVSSSIRSEMDMLREQLADTVRGEVSGYNADVKNMNGQSQRVFEDSLENHERIIKKEISLVQEMMENTLEDQYQKIVDEINNVKKVTKWYTRIAMWASCMALIILFVDIFILKAL